MKNITLEALNAMRCEDASGIKNVDYWRFILIYRFLELEIGLKIILIRLFLLILFLLILFLLIIFLLILFLLILFLLKFSLY